MSEYVKDRVKDHLWSRTLDRVWLRGAGNDIWFRVRCVEDRVWDRIWDRAWDRIWVRVGHSIQGRS